MNLSSSVRRDLASYGIGYALAIVLTGISFAIVFFHLLVPHPAFVILLIIALVQVTVHLRCFLHVSFKRSAREDLHLIMFSTIVILLMLGGTFIVLFDLATRMMM
jgi:cytochrome o ubiquinol oxidase operon protein cyoD